MTGHVENALGQSHALESLKVSTLDVTLLACQIYQSLPLLLYLSLKAACTIYMFVFEREHAHDAKWNLPCVFATSANFTSYFSVHETGCSSLD